MNAIATEVGGSAKIDPLDTEGLPQCSPVMKFPYMCALQISVILLCRKLSKLTGSRQSYCNNKQASYFGPPFTFSQSFIYFRIWLWMMFWQQSRILRNTALAIHVFSSPAVRLSQKTATVAENGEKTATVALFCDSVDRAGSGAEPRPQAHSDAFADLKTHLINCWR